jgi:hypothetical protein
MANIFNKDFREFLALLNKNEVRYIVVGGYAVILNGYRRTTGDLDIWIEPTINNYRRLREVFLTFGLPTTDLTKDKFLKKNEVDVFTYGSPPVCLDIMKYVKGCNFEEAYLQSQIFTENELPIRFLHLKTLLVAKKAAGRYRDLDDIEKLTAIS